MRGARRLLGLAALLGACTPNRPPLPGDDAAPEQPAAPPDMSPAPGPEAPVPAASPLPTPAAAPVQLASDAGLRVVLDVPAYDVLAVPGRLITVEPDLLHLVARDPATGAMQWTTKVQPDAQGWHTLFGLGDLVYLLAGPRRILVDAATGSLRATRQGFYHGADKGCRLDLSAGERSAEWSTWIPATTATATCAQACGCSLFLFDCGGAEAGASFHNPTTHLYRKLSEPHDTVCFDAPGVLARGPAHIVVRAQDDQHKPVILGLDATTFKPVWTRADLAKDISRYGRSGVDPTGQLCWLADDTQLLAFRCATGATRWRMKLSSDSDAADDATIAWHSAGLLVQHRDATRTHVELRDLAGKRRWQRTLPAGHHAVTPDTALGYLGASVAITSHDLLDPATGATIAAIPVADKETLQRSSDGYVRLGPGRYAEFDASGQPIRAADLAGASIVRVTADHLVEREAEQLRVLRRATLTPALTLPGSWSLRASEALGPDVLVLFEHRGDAAPRVLVLRP